MGRSLGSEYKNGIKCCKCGKKLIYFRTLKGHDQYDKAHVMIVRQRRIVHLIWDPSEGKTSGWLYGYYCGDCWKKDSENRRQHGETKEIQ